ncbi:dTDP-4-dehydrorhamnose 3,5-epimerase family protein [Homoserinibacter sp. YIM 151385]|uniref:dTDP-4-dehydrorhamnose 3,5-epimerase family protein n=1 Tax=Homoserinibacter sp. YIM 151385 TaxID=2985506 RepID=UPI0022F0D979|nr:dTDP-4-dehydrorhamnose 3,5-epimerase [Homoserinibacter sp. YIM 151385]WBU38159.1 dTDP-4-dehydrorhamnose 3,5-epimerase [Homoserinibacter sp. YIM 151385]
MTTTFTEFELAETAIDGLLVLRAFQAADERGTVRELFRISRAEGIPGMPAAWSQLNLTSSVRGAVRGLHGEAMTKLVTVAAGRAFGAYVDARPDSATRGEVVTVDLEPGVQVLVPAGVCNGFQALAEEPTEYLYCFDEEWRPGMPGVAVSPLDPELGIDWPIPIDPEDRAMLSAKDAAAPRLAELGGGA